MFTKGTNSKLAFLAFVLLGTAAFSVAGFGQSREPITPPRSTPKGSVDEKARKDEERLRQAQALIQDVLIDTKTILNPIVRIKIRMLAGEAYWNFQPERAREILSQEFPKIASIALPEDQSEFGKVWSIRGEAKTPTYKGVPIDQVRAKLRRDMLAIISAHEPALARSLLAAEKEKEKKDQSEEKADEILATAGDLADTNPEAAARIIRESLKNGVSDMVPFLLARLRDTSPAEASAIFNQVVSGVRSRGDIWEFQQLVPYILPNEQDRLVGGKHYLTDSQRMKDASMVVQYAAELLYRRIQTEAPGNMSPELVRREYFLWRNLLSLFNDLSPEKAWLVNARLRQLTAQMPQTAAPGQTSGPWSDERGKQLIAAADASSGDKRDEYLNNAAFNAWRLGQGDLDKAIFLAEKIGNGELRELTTGTLYFQAGLKYLRSEGPDYALGLVRKINLSGPRTRLYLAIIGTLNSVKASERTETLREELLNWLRNRDKTSDTAWALLDYLDASMNDNPDRNFAAFEILARVLNSPNLDPPENKPKNRIYWYADFHDFRKSLAPFAKADFDRGLEIVRMVNNREVSLQIQAAFFGNYLKLHSQNKKPSVKPVPGSQP